MQIEKFHNWELERALRENGVDGQIVAKKAGIQPGTFSSIKRGRVRPTDDEEKKIAEALGMPVDKLFIRNETANL